MPIINNVTISGGVSLLAPPPPPPGSIQFSNPDSGYEDYGAFADANDLDMGTGNFTIEWWIKYNNFSQYMTPFTKGINTSGELLVQTLITTGKIYFVSVIPGYDAESGSNLSTGVWYHYALVRNGSDVNLYRDGTSTKSGTSNINLTNTSILNIGSGRDPSTGSSNPGINGYISCFRIVKGTAVYTSNFSKPTSPPTAIAGTSLLLLSYSSGTAWADSSGTGKVATVTGGTWSSDNPFS